MPKKGYKHTPEALAKMSAAQTGRKRSPETIEKQRAAQRRRWQNPEARCGMTGMKHTPETRAKMSAWQKGKKHSPEHQAKLDATRRTSENRAKLSIAGRGRKHTPEARTKMGTARVAYLELWPRPVTDMEIALQVFLNVAGFCYVTQRSFGNRIVDAFVPSHNLVFEADGWYWHQDKEKESRRDAYLLSRGVAAVIHLGEADLLP